MAIALPAVSVDPSSLGVICDRIADELVRPDLRASHIPMAVRDAIKEAATFRFWFNEVRGLTFSTVANQDNYGANDLADLAYLSRIDTLWLLINGQRRNMTPVNALDIDNWNEGQSNITGEPCYYARYAGGLTFWMTPRDTWAVTIDGTTCFAPLTDDTQTNAYLSEGERYIRALAKANLLENVIRDFDQADRQWKVAERERKTLASETTSRTTTGRNSGWL